MSEDPRRDYSFDELTRALASGSISRRRALKLFGASVLASVIPARFAFAGVPGNPHPCPPPDQDKVCICHYTGSASNPFVRICVSENAVPAHIGPLGHARDTFCDANGQCPKAATTTTAKPTTTTAKPTTTTAKPTTTTAKPTTTTAKPTTTT